MVEKPRQPMRDRGRALLQRYGWLLAWALLLGATVYAYRGVFSLGFTDEDALGDFAAARVDNPGDLLRQLSSRLTGGLAGRTANFYRPVVMLHYALLRALFGEHPLGYQIWDLALHLGVVAMVGWLISSLGGKRVEAWGVAAVTALHPLGLEVVPAVARNIDLLLPLFVIGSLVAVVHKRAVTAGVLGLLALGTKEPAISVLPLVLLLWWTLHGRSSPTRDVAEGRGLRVLGLIFGLGVPAFLAVRTWVLHGVGGYQHHESLIVLGEVGKNLSTGAWESLFPGWSPELLKVFSSPRRQVFSGLALLAALVAAAVRSWRRGRRLPGYGFLFWLLPMLLFAAVDFSKRRFFYLPEIGLTVALLFWLEDRVLRWPALGILLSMLPASPLFHRDRSWELTDQVTRSVTAAVARAAASLPEGTTIMLIDICVQIDSDPTRARTFWRDGRTLNLCTDYRSLQGWANDRFHRKLRFRPLTTVIPRGPMPAPDLVPVPGGVLLRRETMSREVEPRFAEGWAIEQAPGRLTLRPILEKQNVKLLVVGGDESVLLDVQPISFEER